MENLKILSMNLGTGFIPIKDKKKKEILREKLEEDYDIILLQGNNISFNFDDSNYNAINDNNKLVTLISKDCKSFRANSLGSALQNNIVIYYGNRPLLVMNTNCKQLTDFKRFVDMTSEYSDKDSPYYIRSRIVSGRFPEGINITRFCEKFGLKDLSSPVGQSFHEEHGRKMLNHFFISDNLECKEFYKLVGLVEHSKAFEAYPMEASIGYQKVLK